MVDGEYILRGQYDEELNVKDFYFNPDQIQMVLELLHDHVMLDPDPLGFDTPGNDLLQELTCQVIHHPDNDESVV